MNLNIKTKWLEALRSNKYKQGQSGLCTVVDNKEKYCCLGVLCDIIAPDDWNKDKKVRIYLDKDVAFGYSHSGCQNVLFPGLSVRNKSELGEAEIGKLALLNDIGESFQSIANFIEVNY